MIETARLVLTPWTEADRAPFAAMCADPEVMHDYGAPFDHATATERFERHQAAFARDGFGKWTLRLKSDGSYLGYCGVKPCVADPAARARARDRLAHGPRRLGSHGYATEAARAALADIFARTDADEVVSFTNDSNARSLAVMARLGLARDPDRDFTFETGLAAVVFVAPRSRYAAVTEGTT